MLEQKGLSPELKWHRAQGELRGDPRFAAVAEGEREALWRAWAEEAQQRAASEQDRSRAAENLLAAEFTALLEEKVEADDVSVEALREGKARRERWRR